MTETQLLVSPKCCAWCGDSITGSHGRRIYCSQSCKDKTYHAKQREEKYPSSDLAAKRCAGCNRSMEGMRPHAVYCSRNCKSSAASRRSPATPELNQARYLKERDRRLEYAKKYQRENPDVPKRAKNKRRARKLAAGVFSITSRDWSRLVERQRGECFYCGCRQPLSMDHVVPLFRGGRHSIGNIVAACVPCNSSKRTRYITEWGRRGGTRTTAHPHDRPGVAENGRRQLVPA